MSKRKMALFTSLGLLTIGSLTTVNIVLNNKKEKKEEVLLKATKQFKELSNSTLEDKLNSIELSDIEFSPKINNKNGNKLFSDSKKNISQEELKSFVLLKAKEFLHEVKNGKKDFNDFVEIAEQNGVDTANLIFETSKNKNNIENEELQTFAFGSSMWTGTVEEAAEVINDSAKQSAIYGGISAGLAVGYWLASWWFGISIPSAVAATKQSVALFAESAVYGIAYFSIVNEPEYSLSKNLLLAADNAWQFKSLYDNLKSAFATVKAVSKALKAIILATSFAAPTALILLNLFNISTAIVQAVEFIGS